VFPKSRAWAWPFFLPLYYKNSVKDDITGTVQPGPIQTAPVTPRHQGSGRLPPIAAPAATGTSAVMARAGGELMLATTAPAVTAAGHGPPPPTSIPAVDGARLLAAAHRALHLASRALRLAVEAMDIAALGLAWAGAGRDPAAESAVRESCPRIHGPEPRRARRILAVHRASSWGSPTTPAIGSIIGTVGSTSVATGRVRSARSAAGGWRCCPSAWYGARQCTHGV